MSRLFAESTWEENAVGDKLSKEIFHKKNNKDKKNKKTTSISTKKNSKKTKNIQETLSPKLAAHNKKRPRTISDTEKSSETFSKKAKRKKSHSNSEELTPHHQSQHNNNHVSIQNDSQKKKVKQGEGNGHEDTKSQRKRKKQKQKKITENPKAGLPDNGETSRTLSEKKSSVIKNLNVKRLESMLASKEKSKTSKIMQTPETLRERMMTQLRASRFRYLNETLYNNESSESKRFFKEDPDAFAAYHAGYKQQVEQWPLNPLDVIISSISKLPKDYVIADFGCGEARLAESVTQRVHSFDLVAVNDKVKACDMAHTPLLTHGINVAVFCLSLMGTNLGDYLLEANRVLKMDGIMKIADVESRFENIDEFITLLKSYGFINTWKDLSHNLFYFMDFKKISDVNRNAKKLPQIALKPCVYKKR
ncbi:ribosomal RNA-processing protein 8 [Venturia canescens]|uniref:ribosomal RNA-processing protein 8 n=1 Tax=Venturia canescens TaxID=32260 RepID=UPI001C9CB9B4|nr:ribosomal RNA-processing protein 8 [Venturia canescens]